MDKPTADLIQAAVNMERKRCAAIALREALWLLGFATGEPLQEANRLRRESLVASDIAEAILRGE